jgi:hypothetical protein
MEFPRLVYKSASNHVVANDEQQFEQLIADGWFPTVPEAIAGKLNPTDNGDESDEALPTREELETKATELGIKFQPNIGDKKLAAKIADALKG